ncbi:MAG: biopolymer transporter ExbD [Gammaproteobacteria bacterium]|jgi:biopolymer transport protein ExbD|nr:biopolymer transporter ExbD [Gammaproteobacteria bacterium]
MQFELPRRPRRRLITLTPLIDVVFILLLFFMLASRLTQLDAIPVDAPARAQAATPTPALLLRIHADGQLDLNGEPIPAGELEPALSGWLERAPTLRVLLQPADQVPLQTTLGVFDRVAAAGVTILRLQ